MSELRTSVSCPDCGQDLPVAEGEHASTGVCPNCGRKVPLPPPQSDDTIPPSSLATLDPDRTVAPSTRSSLGADTVAQKTDFSFLAQAQAPDELGRLGEYRVLKLLGEGGMGMVFQGEDPHLQRHVALKVIRPAMARDTEFRQRFLREARAIAALKSDHVVVIFQVVDAEVPFLAMEFLQGETLDDWLDREKKPGTAEVLRIGREIAQGLSAAHAGGLVHRDIKPANIWLEGPERRVKILDFGLARATLQNKSLTQPGLILGTPEYMAPEQAEGEPVDARADLFSLGCVLYRMLAGVGPFSGGSVLTILKAVVAGNPKPLRELNAEASPALVDLVHRLLKRNPADRPESASAVVEALKAMQAPATAACSFAPQALATPVSAPAPPAAVPPRRRNYWMAATVLLGLVLAACFMLHHWMHEPGEELVFGMSAPFDGPSQELGEQLKSGIDVYFQRVNDEGGIHGHRLRLIALNDDYNPQSALANVRELREQKHVFGLLGNVGTAPVTASLPYAVENKMLFFGSLSGGKVLRKDPPERYVFNYRASFAEETERIVNYFCKARHIKPEEIAVLAQNDATGDDGFEGVARALRDYGIDKKNILRVGYAREHPDSRPAAETLVGRKDVKAVIMIATYVPAAEAIEHLHHRRDDLTLATISFVGGTALLGELQKMSPVGAHGEGVIVTQVVPHPESNATGVLRYREDVKKFAPNKKPTFNSLEGYIAAAILVEGLKRAGHKPTTENVVEALESIKDWEMGIGTKISFSPDNHQGSHKVWGTRIKQGKFEVIDDFD